MPLETIKSYSQHELEADLYPLLAGGCGSPLPFMTWTLISNGEPTLETRRYSRPTWRCWITNLTCAWSLSGRNGMKSKFITFWGNNSSILKGWWLLQGLSASRTTLNLRAGRIIVMNLICHNSQKGHCFFPLNWPPEFSFCKDELRAQTAWPISWVGAHLPLVFIPTGRSLAFLPPVTQAKPRLIRLP